VAGKFGLQHRGQRLDLALHILGQLQQGSLGHFAGQRDDQDRELRQVDLVDRHRFGVVGKFGLGQIDLVAHIGQGCLLAARRCRAVRSPSA
jgi:hypothetical protein